MAYQINRSSTGLSGVDIAYLLSCQPSVSPAFPTVLSRSPSAHRYWGVADASGNLPMQVAATSTAGGDESFYAHYYVNSTGSCSFKFSFDGEHTYTLNAPWSTSSDPYPWGQAGSKRYSATSMTFSHLSSFYAGDREGIGFLTARNSTYNDRDFNSVTFHQGASLALSTTIQPGSTGYLPNTFVIPVYQAIHRTITLSSNGASIPDDSLVVYADDFPGFNNPISTVTHSPPPLPTPASPSGWSFDGWYTAPTGGTKVESIDSFPSQDVTYYAHWIRDTEITFNPNGGYLADADKTRYVPVGSALGTLPTPIRTGYTFLGWFTAASGGTQVTDSTVITESTDVTYYAHWSKNNVYAMLDAAGGTCDPAILEVTVGGTYAALPTPTRPNYSFDGWFTAASGGTQVNDATTVTSTVDHTLYAHWTAHSTPAQNGDLIYDDATGRLIYDDRPVQEP